MKNVASYVERAKEDWHVVCELALTVKATDGIWWAEQIVYDANLLGYLPDPKALYILNKLNGYL